MPSFKDIYISLLMFWEGAMESLTESWKEGNIGGLDECSSNANDIQHVAIKGEN
jgi:hypothetical protein